MVRLGDLCRFINGDRGRNYPSQVEISSDGDIPFINAGHLIDGKLDFSDMNYISEEKYNQLNSGKVQENDVLYCLRGSLGKKTIIKDISKGAIASSLVIIRPDAQLINSDYLFYALESPTIQEQMMQANNGSSQPNLSAKSVSDYTFNLPDIDVQIEIVSKLAKVNDLITLRKQQLAKLDELVKSRFIKLFGDTTLNPFDWEKDFLGAICDVRDGTHDSPQYYEIGYPLVTSKNVTSGKIDLTDCSLICEADFRKINERSKVDIGDIIMPMIGTVGKPVIVDIEPDFAIKNVSLIKFKADSRVLNIYIHALLQSDYFDDTVLSKVRGGTQKFISLGDIRKLEVLVPPLNVQEQFATFVEQTDKSKLAVQQGLDKLETLKKALMQEYFG